MQVLLNADCESLSDGVRSCRTSLIVTSYISLHSSTLSYLIRLFDCIAFSIASSRTVYPLLLASHLHSTQFLLVSSSPCETMVLPTHPSADLSSAVMLLPPTSIVHSAYFTSPDIARYLHLAFTSLPHQGPLPLLRHSTHSHPTLPPTQAPAPTARIRLRTCIRCSASVVIAARFTALGCCQCAVCSCSRQLFIGAVVSLSGLALAPCLPPCKPRLERAEQVSAHRRWAWLDTQARCSCSLLYRHLFLYASLASK